MPADGRLRADAQRSRAALIAAARAVMGRRGIDAPLDEIASAAGVGNATLYRHFPTRHDLLAAVFADQMARYGAAVERAIEVPDPWQAVRDYLVEICALQAENQALADLVTSVEFTDETRPVAVAHLQALLQRAQAAGRLRPDFSLSDVALVLLANAGVVRSTGEQAPAATSRLVALLLDGLQVPTPAGEVTAPDTTPPDPAGTAPAPSGPAPAPSPSNEERTA